MNKILVIEDEIMLQQAYARILSSKGYDVHVASDGIEGLEKLKKVKPAIILLDILMPKMDGLEFLKNANIRDKFPNTKVLAFSNLSNSSKINEMMDHGATRHVLKSSVSPGELIIMIEQLLKKS